MPEPEFSAIDLYQARADRRVQHADPHLGAHHQRGGGQHLTQPRAVIQRGHQQGGACVSGQIEGPGSKGPLQAGRERQPGGHPGAGAELAVGDRQFHQRQRITRRFVEQPGAHVFGEPGSAGVQQRRRR